jgi:hypothetical protein
VPTSDSSLSLETITTSSTSTHTITINIGQNPTYSSAPSYAGAVITSVPTSASADTSACNAFSTIYITITGTLPSPSPASGSVSSTNTNLPANPLYSQSQLHGTTSPSSVAASAVGGYQASTDALSATGAHTITSSLMVVPTAAASNSSSSTNGTAPSTSPFVGPNTSSNMAHAVRGKKQVNVALMLCAVGTLVMFAV